MEPRTLALLKTSLKRGDERRVKPARYFQEFRKILKEEVPSRAIVRLSRLGGMEFFQKGFHLSRSALTVIKQVTLRVKDDPVFSREDVGGVSLMALARGFAREDVCAMSERFHWPRHERETMAQSLQADAILKKLRKEGLRLSEVYRILRPIDAKVIAYLRVLDRHPRTQHYIEEYFRVCQTMKWTVTAEDCERLAVPPGRRRGVILRNLLYRKLDGEITTRRQELKILKELTDRRSVDEEG
jgi:tRNA nucleotidyltransferase (CCA-adding enzyme)